MADTAELAAVMGPVALLIWGEPSERSKTQLRFGRKGSVAVDLNKGTWYDHEAGEGGGVLDALKMRMQGVHNDQEAFAWLEMNGLWRSARPSGNGHHGPREGQRRTSHHREPTGELVATFPYVDEDSRLLFEVLKYVDQATGDRDFRQRRPDGNGGWINNLRDVRRVPYRLAELRRLNAGDLILVPEGEKDVDNCYDVLGPATCNPMGAGKWPNMAAALNPHFANLDVVILADNDDAGRKHAVDVATALTPIAKRVRVMFIEELWPEAPHKADISDWINAELDVDYFREFIEGLETWKPQAEPEPARATLYIVPDPSTIPMRAWLWAGHYVRQACTATVAPGGFGKTTLQLYEAIKMVGEGLSVWYLSGEDPKVEIDRRIAAHCKQHNIRLQDLPGKLYVDDRSTFTLTIATQARSGYIKFEDAMLALFESTIVADKIDVVMLDPFIAFHNVAENDNTAIDAVVKRLAFIAQRTNSCIEISHHVRKPFAGQGSLSVDDARGGSSIIAAVRSGRVINRMTAGEATQAVKKLRNEHGTIKPLDEIRHFYIRLDLGKRNMAPPEHAHWFRLLNVPIENGDNVQALKPWEFPALFDGVEDKDTEFIRAAVQQRAYRADSQSDDWLGHLIAEQLKLDVAGDSDESKEDIKKVKKLIKVWELARVFKRQRMRDDKTRKQVTWFVSMDKPSESAVLQFPDRNEGNDDD